MIVHLKNENLLIFCLVKKTEISSHVSKVLTTFQFGALPGQLLLSAVAARRLKVFPKRQKIHPSFGQRSTIRRLLQPRTGRESALEIGLKEPKRAAQERDDYSSFSAGGREGDELPRE